ncbi:MAG: D-3-phosphoglycerate dehydrogenase [Candidatus Magnetoglobus multicellularis str. Araruama]|uniref:D-3-phosphoglycerate dehydrogenase n=1 Tax=Candidatus Magnetoglobus multicellularis str. Araruama TaxID=890399 RepID=A0A1V1NUW6_9BACT|nr:MAG: D-3-phosphoglycerate dehydrogenase [Candidatus Magnetoglobus multicellularis str. Araruama]
MFKIKTLNQISDIGLNLLAASNYKIATELADPDAILLRSFKMHDMALNSALKVVGRAGAGVNNIPIAKCSAQGIVVMNTPGANANAVKELVLAALFLAARKILAE